MSDGLPCFSMVGFLASEVKEAKERVSIAIRNSGFRIPPKKITINLSPADFRKAGTGYDLAIAAAILGALGYFPQEYLEERYAFGRTESGWNNPADQWSSSYGVYGVRAWLQLLHCTS